MKASTTAKTLARDTRCALCGEKMRAGEAFRWYLKSGVSGGSRAGGTNADTARRTLTFWFVTASCMPIGMRI